MIAARRVRDGSGNGRVCSGHQSFSAVSSASRMNTGKPVITSPRLPLGRIAAIACTDLP